MVPRAQLINFSSPPPLTDVGFGQIQFIFRPPKEKAKEITFLLFLLTTPFLAKTQLPLPSIGAFPLIHRAFSSRFWTEIIDRLKKPPPVYRPVVPPEYAPPECLQLMQQCWAESAEQRPTFDEIFNQVRTLWILVLPGICPEASLPKTNSLGSHHIVEGNSHKGKSHGGEYLEAFEAGASPAHPPRARGLVLMLFCIWTSVPAHLQSDLTNLSEMDLNHWAMQWY